MKRALTGIAFGLGLALRLKTTVRPEAVSAIRGGMEGSAEAKAGSTSSGGFGLVKLYSVSIGRSSASGGGVGSVVAREAEQRQRKST
jgi:hypothetical protein